MKPIYASQIEQQIETYLLAAQIPRLTLFVSVPVYSWRRSSMTFALFCGFVASSSSAALTLARNLVIRLATPAPQTLRNKTPPHTVHDHKTLTRFSYI